MQNTPSTTSALYGGVLEVAVLIRELVSEGTGEAWRSCCSLGRASVPGKWHPSGQGACSTGSVV